MAEDAPKRVLLKLSGEALMGDLPYGIDPAMLDAIAGQLKAVQSMGIEVAIVVGAGSIFRGVTASATVTAAAEPYTRRRAIRPLEKGRVVIFAAGTGTPYMTTDTAAALRAIEIDAEVLLMAKKNVDGVYEADPLKDRSARKFSSLSYLDALNRRVQVMDSTALSLCMENSLPIIVFDLRIPHSIELAASGRHTGTIVGELPTELAEPAAAKSRQ